MISTSEQIIYQDDKQSIGVLPVAGGTIYRHSETYCVKNQYGKTNSITFVPDSVFARLTNWIKSLWK